MELANDVNVICIHKIDCKWGLTTITIIYTTALHKLYIFLTMYIYVRRSNQSNTKQIYSNVYTIHIRTTQVQYSYIHSSSYSPIIKIILTSYKQSETIWNLILSQLLQKFKIFARLSPQYSICIFAVDARYSYSTHLAIYNMR